MVTYNNELSDPQTLTRKSCKQSLRNENESQLFQ